MADIYLHINGTQLGPYSEQQVRQALAEGQFTNDVLAWKEGLAEWVSLSNVMSETMTPAQSQPESRSSSPSIQQISQPSVRKGRAIQTAVTSLVIIVVLFVGLYIGIQQLRQPDEKAQIINCENDLERLGFALHLYAIDHDGKLPLSWADASKEIAVPVKLHFQAGTADSPLTSIYLANQSDKNPDWPSGITFSVVDSSGYHVAGDITSEKEDNAKGLIVDASGTPALLICPGDGNHKVAASWEELTASNTSYDYDAQDAKWEDNDSDRIVCVCRIHPCVLLANGTVERYVDHPEWIVKRDGHLYYKRQ